MIKVQTETLPCFKHMNNIYKYLQLIVRIQYPLNSFSLIVTIKILAVLSCLENFKITKVNRCLVFENYINQSVLENMPFKFDSESFYIWYILKTIIKLIP